MKRAHAFAPECVTSLHGHASIALKACMALTCLVLCTGPGAFASWFVTTNGSSSNSGTASSPWSLAYALSGAGGAIHAGDTVYIRGGTYLNPHDGQQNGSNRNGYAAFPISISSGTFGHPVIFRAYPGESVVWDGGSTLGSDIVQFQTPNVWLWGIEIMSSNTNRSDPTGGACYGDASFPDPLYMPVGVGTNFYPGATRGIKLINCIIHDCQEGYGNTNWQTCLDAEFYGGLVYNNGWTAPDRSHGHNVYIQNTTGSIRKLTNMIDWGASENNIQAYGSNDNGQLVTRDFTFRNDIIFQTGTSGENLLIGGGGVAANNDVIDSCSLYQNNGQALLDLGWVPYGGGITNLTVTNNYGGGHWAKFQSPVTVTAGGGNTLFIAASEGSLPGSVTAITTAKPTTNVVKVYRNAYEPARANIAIYNWQNLPTVSVDVSGVLAAGSTYYVIDAENPAHKVIASSTFSGGSISIPMTGLTAVQPIGNSGQTRTHTAPEFGAFILIGSVASVPAENPPTVVSEAATALTGTTATMNGDVNPNGNATTYRFDYGLTAGYGTSTSTGNAGTGISPVPVSAQLSGLSPATMYHYRIVASNNGGTTVSGDLTLTTTGGTLPIQLCSFNAVPATAPGAVELSWATASETNNFGFFVRRSASLSSGFADLPGGFVPGSGTTLEARTYAWVDRSPLAGTSYYMLKQVDLDGSIRMSDPVKVVVHPADLGQPAAFALGQNFPNPFNPSTHIRFSVDNGAYTTLKVYNMLGQAVSTLFEGMAESGREYDVAFDGSSLASGAYFYQLLNGSHAALKRMVLVR